MTESEFLERIDGHLARADEHMARGNEIMARSDKTMARGNEIMTRSNEIMTRSNEIMTRSDVTMAKSAEAHSGLREFIRETTLRQERSTDRVVRHLDDVSARMQAGTVQLQDLNLATRQHTQALGRILDRLE